MRAVLTILAKDLRLRVRDRSAFVVGILAPLVLGTILSLVVGDFGGGGAFDAKWAIVDEDGGEIGEEIARQLGEVSDDVEVDLDLTETEARSRVDDGDLAAAIVIPSGFQAGLAPGGQPEDVVVLSNVDADLSEAVARGIAEGLAAQSEAVRLAVYAATAAGAQPSDELVAEARSQPPPVQVVMQETDERELDATTYLMAGLGAMFVFFLVQYGVVGLLEERQAGTMARLLAAPIPPLSIPLAKALTSLVLGLFGLGTLAVVSSLALGADWGDPLAAAVLIGAMVLTAVGIVGIVCGVAKTADQATSAQSVIALLLGLFGGSFFPIAQGEGFLTKLTYVTPQYWFLRGLADGKVGGLADAWPSVVALLVFAAVAGTLGVLLLRRGAWR